MAVSQEVHDAVHLQGSFTLTEMLLRMTGPCQRADKADAEAQEPIALTSI